MTKIDIISGFLGAGKTTFIKKLLEEAIAGEQVVLIENEFGEIGIDGGFLKNSGIEIREMNSGCICCSLVGDFGKSLEEVLTRYQPERVIIEPSGVGKLSDVMNAVRDVAKNLEVRLNSAVTIVDACKCKMYMKNFGEFFNNQVENAGTIVLSRTDVADAKKVQADVELLRAHNSSASIVTTPVEQLTGSQLLALIEKPDTMMEELLAQVEEEHHHHEHDENCTCGCHDHEHHHEHHHDEECGCHDHEHHHEHHHDEECGCHDHEHHHEHHHDEECGCHDHEHHHEHHHHEHDENCTCGCHDHDHDHHHHHHHDHDEDDHDHDCCCHHHHDEDDDEDEHEHHHHDHDDDDHDHDCCHHHDDEDEHEHHHEHHYDEHGVCSCGHHHHHDHDADEVFTSWGKETAHKYSREDLDKALHALDEGAYGMILRAKGIVDGGDTWYEFDMVPGEHEIRSCGPDVTGKLCVIGSQLKEHEIAELFHV